MNEINNIINSVNTIKKNGKEMEISDGENTCLNILYFFSNKNRNTKNDKIIETCIILLFEHILSNIIEYGDEDEIDEKSLLELAVFCYYDLKNMPKNIDNANKLIKEISNTRIVEKLVSGFEKIDYVCFQK